MIQRICNLLLTLVLISILGIAGALGIPQLMGYKVCAVLTGSMEPTLPVGSVVYIQPVAPQGIQVGDVLTFRASGFDSLATHRVMEIDKEHGSFITKGDRNPVNDLTPVPFANTVGKVTYAIPLLGYLSVLMQTRVGMLGIAAVFAVVLLLFIIPDLFKKQAAPEQTADTTASGENSNGSKS